MAFVLQNGRPVLQIFNVEDFLYLAPIKIGQPNCFGFAFVHQSLHGFPSLNIMRVFVMAVVAFGIAREHCVCKLKMLEFLICSAASDTQPRESRKQLKRAALRKWQN